MKSKPQLKNTPTNLKQTLKRILNGEPNSPNSVMKLELTHLSVTSKAKKGVFQQFSNFSHILGIKVLKLCEKYKGVNGGIMAIEDIVKINNKIKYNDKISKDDVINAMKHFSVLGTGCTVVDNQFISTSPFPLSKDSVQLLGMFKEEGVVNESLVKHKFGWNSEKFNFVMVT